MTDWITYSVAIGIGLGIYASITTISYFLKRADKKVIDNTVNAMAEEKESHKHCFCQDPKWIAVSKCCKCNLHHSIDNQAYEDVHKEEEK